MFANTNFKAQPWILPKYIKTLDKQWPAGFLCASVLKQFIELGVMPLVENIFYFMK